MFKHHNSKKDPKDDAITVILLAVILGSVKRVVMECQTKGIIKMDSQDQIDQIINKEVNSLVMGRRG